MTTEPFLRHLIGVIEASHPYVYCWHCLAARLGVDEANVRDAAQMLLFRERETMRLAWRECFGCGETDQMLVSIKTAL